MLFALTRFTRTSLEVLNHGRPWIRLLASLSALLLAASVSGQTILLDTRTADAGTVQRGTQITKEFVVKNVGSAPLRITDVKPACGCTQARFDKVISPGGSGKIVLTIDTTAFRTAISKSAVVMSNDPTTPELSLIVVANVRGAVRGEPSDSLSIRTTQGQLGAAEMVLASEHPDFKPTGLKTSEPYLRAVLLPDPRPGRWKVVVTSDAAAPAGPLLETVIVKTGIAEEPEFRISVNGVITVAGQAGTEPATEAAITNEEVVKLVAADLGDEIVIAKIKNTPVARLDVSTDGLLALKEKKVSKGVITAMIERAGQPNKTAATIAPSAATAAPPAGSASGPCAGIELMGLYKNELVSREMSQGGLEEWLAKIRNNTGVTKIIKFGWIDQYGQQQVAQVELRGGDIATPRLDLTQKKFIAPVRDLKLVSCQ